MYRVIQNPVEILSEETPHDRTAPVAAATATAGEIWRGTSVSEGFIQGGCVQQENEPKKYLPPCEICSFKVGATAEFELVLSRFSFS